MPLNHEERIWLEEYPERCSVCDHLKAFHVRWSDGCCIVGECTCDGRYLSIEAANEARLAEHIDVLESKAFADMPWHVGACSICQDHLTATGNTALKEYYQVLYDKNKAETQNLAPVYQRDPWFLSTVEEHLAALATCTIPKQTGHADQCPLCQEYLATQASETVCEFYNYPTSAAREGRT